MLVRTVREEENVSQFVMFHGRECPHCRKMMPLVEKLEKDTGLAFDKKEVWHSEENANLMRSLKEIIYAKCGGDLKVPTFYNSETKDVVCGEMAYEALKAWTAR
jgi:thiol-disulfide isomerase/thioredoxin